MAKITPPKYRRQISKKNARAFVVLNNVRVYIGQYGSDESYEKYHRLVAEWTANGRRHPHSPNHLSITNLLARFWEHVQVYYVKPDGTQTSEVSNFKRVLKILRRLYGSTLVNDFGPKKLKTVRQNMVDQGWVRGSVNKNIGRLKMIFRWGVAEELVCPTIYQALQAVPGLKQGRCSAKEAATVRPVSETDIEAVHAHVSLQIWSIIQLQLLTAARSGELLRLRPCDIDQSEQVWIYTPLEHKTAHQGHERRIYIGPRAKVILEPFLRDRPATAYVFSAEEAANAHIAKRHAKRKTPLSCGNKPGTNRVNEVHCKPGPRYRVDSYRRAIKRACKLAGVQPWHPHQLRHTAATLIRRQFGLEAAQLLLGHSKADVTQIYAEANNSKAIQVAEKIG